MKLFFSILVLVAVFQFGSSNVSSKRDILLSDATAVQNGSDVIMVKPGPLEVVLNNASELIFEFCSKKCTADFNYLVSSFLVCFESDPSGQNVLESCDTKCGFYASANNEYFSPMKPLSILNPGYMKSDQCFELKMMSNRSKLTFPNDEILFFPSCDPKVENGIVKLNIMNATSDCVVSIKNAKIKQDEITTLPNSPAKDPTNSPSNNPSSAAANIIGSFGWIFVLISFCILHR
uniref:Transmembrane protein n=1 Tax=Panagrolaimus davidi TaxID=227884 RepID=A0A914QEB4_9BILA